MRWMILGMCGFGLAACDFVPRWAGGNRPIEAVSQPIESAAPVQEVETPIDDAAPLEEAVVPEVGPPTTEVSTGTLGRTIASLGDAAQPGLWLKTPLVSAEQPGRVYYAQTNTTVDVTLIPIDGPDTAGSRLSLAAMQALGAPLTGLPEVDVFSN